MPPRATSALLVALAMGGIACSREQKQPASEPSTVQPKPIEPKGSASAPVASAPSVTAAPSATPAKPTSLSGALDSLYVASSQGVREVALDGTTMRVLSKTPAEKPRFLPHGKALVFLANEHRELRKLTLADGREELVATLPSELKQCGARDVPDGKVSWGIDELDAQDDTDFLVDKSGLLVCIDLRNRNANMADYWAHLRVDLRNKAIEQRELSPGNCGEPKLVRCERPESTWSPPKECALTECPYSVKDGVLSRHGSKGKVPVVTLPPGDWDEEGQSASGTWAVLSGAISEGDYIHRNLVFLNRKTGAMIPIRDGAAPAPLSQAQIAKLAEVPTYDAVGETRLDWLPTADALLVDHLLFVPGKAPVDLGGDVAPW